MTAVSYTHLDVYKRQVERLRHIAAWMDKYLLGHEIHAYDLQ